MNERRILRGLVAGFGLWPVFLDRFSAATASTSAVAKVGLVAIRPAYEGISFPHVAGAIAVPNSYQNSFRVTDRVFDSVIPMVAASGLAGQVA